MKKSEIKNLTNNALIVEYVKTYANYDTNFVLGRGTDNLVKHLRDLEAELLKREMLTEDDVRYLNS